MYHVYPNLFHQIRVTGHLLAFSSDERIRLLQCFLSWFQSIGLDVFVHRSS